MSWETFGDQGSLSPPTLQQTDTHRPQATHSTQVKGKLHTQATPGWARPPHHSHQALTRIWFRSCSASCLSCSSSLMAPGPWGGVGGGWGPRDGGWGRQLLAAGPRPGGGGRECKADVRPRDGPGSGRERRGGSAGPGKDLPGRGSRGRGTQGRVGVSGTERRCQGTNDFPNLPPGPPETEWEVQEEEQGGNPSLGQQPGRDTRAAGTGDGGGGESLRKQTWRPPQPAQGAALPAPNFKKGRYLFKFTPTHRTPSTHTPS